MNVYIWSPDHLANHADSLHDTLNRAGYTSRVLDDVEILSRYEDDQESLYIFYCPQVFPAPHIIKSIKKYIVYNTEHESRFLATRETMHMFEGAMQIWSHISSTANMVTKYLGLPSAVVPPGIIRYPVLPKSDDILFIGTMNEKRIRQINFFRGYGCHVKTITQPNTAFGIDALLHYSAARMSLNLHYNHSAPLELFRIHEALSCRCHVISEPSDDNAFLFDYTSGVTFFNDIPTMVIWARYLLSREISFNFDINKIDNTKIVLEQMKKLNQ